MIIYTHALLSTIQEGKLCLQGSSIFADLIFVKVLKRFVKLVSKLSVVFFYNNSVSTLCLNIKLLQHNEHMHKPV